MSSNNASGKLDLPPRQNRSYQMTSLGREDLKHAHPVGSGGMGRYLQRETTWPCAIQDFNSDNQHLDCIQNVRTSGIYSTGEFWSCMCHCIVDQMKLLNDLHGQLLNCIAVQVVLTYQQLLVQQPFKVGTVLNERNLLLVLKSSGYCTAPVLTLLQFRCLATILHL